MVALVIAAASICQNKAVGAKSPVSTEIPVELSPGECIISVPIGSKTFKFEISTYELNSYFSKDVKDALAKSNDKENLHIGPDAVAISSLQVQDLEGEYAGNGYDGILGMDCLSKIVFGIDYQTKKFFVWPADGPYGWTTATAPTIVASISKDDQWPYVWSSYGWLLFDTSTPDIFAPTAVDSQKDFLNTGLEINLDFMDLPKEKAELKIAPSFNTQFTQVKAFPVFVSSAFDKDGGYIAPDCMASGFILDAKNHLLILTPYANGREVFHEIIWNIFGEDTIWKDHQLFLKPSDEDFSKMTGGKDATIQIVSLNGTKIADLASSYATNDVKAATMLADVCHGIAEGCNMIILLNGKEITVRIQMSDDMTAHII